MKAQWIEGIVLVALLGAGLASPWGIGLWYAALVACFVGIAGGVLALESLAALVAERPTERLQ